jgi:hypothetical protein
MSSCMIGSTQALLMLYINGKNLSEEDLEESILALSNIVNRNELINELYLLSMYHLLVPLKHEDSLLQIFSKINEDSFVLSDFSDGLIYAKFLLAKVLCGMEIKDRKIFSSFAKIEYLSELSEITLLGVLSLFIGIFSKKAEIYEQGCLIAELLLKVMNGNGEVGALFLMGKGQYKKDSCRVLSFILMSLYHGVTRDEKSRTLLAKLDPFEGGLFQELDVEAKLSLRLLELALLKCHSFTIRPILDNKVEGLITIDTKGFTYTSTTTRKDGIGSISYEGLLIVPSFGPHVLPLGKSDLYGVAPSICEEGVAEGHTVTMWNRVKSKDFYGNHWVHAKISASDSCLGFESFIWSEKKEESLSLIFFIRGESIQIDDRTYHSGGLERVYAKTSKLNVDIKGRVLEIHSKELQDVEIIPLAGQEFFWNSDFIISFPYSKDKVLSLDWIMNS